jgi:transposase
VVDAASIAVNRRRRRAKTDRIDVEALLRSLMAWARGERAVCSMVRAPSPEEEDARRLTRERGTLMVERVRHVNRIKGLLATQGVFVFEPIRKDRRQRWRSCGDGMARYSRRGSQQHCFASSTVWNWSCRSLQWWKPSEIERCKRTTR